MNAIKQAIRGCGTLPHVGEHPGTEMVIALILMGALAGYKGGWWGALGGACFMALFVVPMYLCGAHGRATTSDEIERQENPPRGRIEPHL